MNTNYQATTINGLTRWTPNFINTFATRGTLLKEGLKPATLNRNDFDKDMTYTYEVYKAQVKGIYENILALDREHSVKRIYTLIEALGLPSIDASAVLNSLVLYKFTSGAIDYCSAAAQDLQALNKQIRKLSNLDALTTEQEEELASLKAQKRTLMQSEALYHDKRVLKVSLSQFTKNLEYALYAATVDFDIVEHTEVDVNKRLRRGKQWNTYLKRAKALGIDTTPFKAMEDVQAGLQALKTAVKTAYEQTQIDARLHQTLNDKEIIANATKTAKAEK